MLQVILFRKKCWQRNPSSSCTVPGKCQVLHGLKLSLRGAFKLNWEKTTQKGHAEDSDFHVPSSWQSAALLSAKYEKEAVMLLRHSERATWGRRADTEWSPWRRGGADNTPRWKQGKGRGRAVRAGSSCPGKRPADTRRHVHIHLFRHTERVMCTAQ